MYAPWPFSSLAALARSFARSLAKCGPPNRSALRHWARAPARLVHIGCSADAAHLKIAQVQCDWHTIINVAKKKKETSCYPHVSNHAEMTCLKLEAGSKLVSGSHSASTQTSIRVQFGRVIPIKRCSQTANQVSKALNRNLNYELFIFRMLFHGIKKLWENSLFL